MDDITNDQIQQKHIKSANQIIYVCGFCGSTMEVVNKHLLGRVMTKEVTACGCCEEINTKKIVGVRPKQIIVDDIWG